MNLEETIKRLLSLGLTTLPEEMIMFTDEPKFPAYVSVPNEELSKTTGISEVFGQGLSEDPLHAKVKTIGECIERICLFHAKNVKFLKSRFSEGAFLDPRVLVPFSREQIGEKNVGEYYKRRLEARYNWVEGRDLINEQEILVPGQIVFLSNEFMGEEPLREQISTGAALHSDEDEAIISGILEVIERDAYITSYLTKRKIKKIKIEANEELSQLISYFRRYRLEPHIFDITSDLGVPTVMSLVLDDSGIGPAVNLGLKCSLDYKSAIKGSLFESIQCRRMTRLMRGVEYKELPNENELTTMKDRYFYWYGLERIKDLDFWLASNESVDLNDLRDPKVKKGEELTYLKNKIKERGYGLIKVDIGWSEIREAGFFVVKIIIPELHTLYLNEGWKALYSQHAGVITDLKELKPQPFT